MTRLIKSEVRFVSLYLEEKYVEYIFERRFKRLLQEMEDAEREILEELMNF